VGEGEAGRRFDRVDACYYSVVRRILALAKFMSYNDSGWPDLIVSHKQLLCVCFAQLVLHLKQLVLKKKKKKKKKKILKTRHTLHISLHRVIETNSSAWVVYSQLDISFNLLRAWFCICNGHHCFNADQLKLLLFPSLTTNCFH
jgi:hypothetical protein